jgi:hypothetical protein
MNSIILVAFAAMEQAYFLNLNILRMAFTIDIMEIVMKNYLVTPTSTPITYTKNPAR